MNPINSDIQASPSCKWCRFGSRVFGHGLTNLLSKKWDRIELEDVRLTLQGLDLAIVGGLAHRGHTVHDIDVIGRAEDVPILVDRLSTKDIDNLVHYCGRSLDKHDHLTALVNGFLVTFFGNRIYRSRRFQGEK